MAELAGNVSIVTGASRDIGAEIALAIAREGGHVVIGCNDKEGRARKVAEEVLQLSSGKVETEIVAADLRIQVGIEELIDRAVALSKRTDGQLAALVLSAAMGYGMSREQAAELNVTGNLRLAHLFSEADIDVGVENPKNRREGFDTRDILFLQSHPSHLFLHPDNGYAVTDEYLPVAASKHDAEKTLRAEFVDNPAAQPDRRLLVLSGDLVDGTTVAKLIGREYSRANPGHTLVADRNEQMREIVQAQIPTKEQFASMAVQMLLDEDLPNGHIRFMPRPLLQQHGELYPVSPAGLSFGVGQDPAMYSFVA